MNDKKEIMKNIGIIVLAIIAIALLMIVLFYNKISVGRIIPRVDSYELSDEVKKEIGNVDLDENSEIITTYQLDASELKSYEKTKQYNKGKKDPFAQQSTQGDSSKQTGNNSGNSDDETTNEDDGKFYEDDGTK